MHPSRYSVTVKDPIGTYFWGHGLCYLLVMSKDGAAMARRFLISLAMMAITVMAAAGCDSLRQAIRSGKDSQGGNLKSTSYAVGAPAVESDPSKIQAVDSTDKNPQPFFQGSRRSGGWSSEAREIESHLGVGP